MKEKRDKLIQQEREQNKKKIKRMMDYQGSVFNISDIIRNISMKRFQSHIEISLDKIIIS